MLSVRITSRCLCLCSSNWRNHYETLGVSPKATHAEIKSAYYKLSLQYHPDRQDGNREKFEQITDAYKVIGDHMNRGLYDRGAFQDSSQSKPKNYYSQSKPQARRPDVPAGKTPIYDFDEWSRAHYGKTMARRQAAKARYDDFVNANSREKVKGMNENVTMSLVFTILCVFSITILYNNSFDDFDRPQPKSNK